LAGNFCQLACRRWGGNRRSPCPVCGPASELKVNDKRNVTSENNVGSLKTFRFLKKNMFSSIREKTNQLLKSQNQGKEEIRNQWFFDFKLSEIRPRVVAG
jgi:phage terminase large subunit GpA-like protein